MSLGSSNPTANVTKLAGTTIDVGAGNSTPGTQRVVIATNQLTLPVSGNAANGAAVSGNPLLIGGSDGTNARSIKVATDGTLLINGVQDNRTAGTITTATSVVGPVSVINRNVTTITVSGTYAGVTFVIEATDDGTNWYGLQCINNASGQAAATWTPGTNALASYDTAVGGYTQVRVRATAWTSGTMNVGISNQVFAYDPIVAALSQGLAPTGTALIGNPILIGGSDGTNARNIATDTAGAIKIAAGTNNIGTFSRSTSTSTATVLGALNAAVTLDVSGNRGAGCTITATATPAGMVLTPYVSYDGGNTWTTTYFDNPNGDVESTIQNASLAVGLAKTIVTTGGASHVKVQATAWTSGSVTILIRSTEVADPTTLYGGTNNSANRPPVTAQIGGWDGTGLRTILTDSVGRQLVSGAAANGAAVVGNPVLIGGWDGTNARTISTNTTGAVNVAGTFWQTTQPVSLAALPALSAGSAAIGSITNTTFASTQSGAWSVTAVGSAANGAAVSGNPLLMGGSDGTNARSLKVATDGTLLINGVQDSRSSGTVTTATSVVGPVSVSNRNVTTITVSGTYAGVTFVIEATDDGTNWYGLQCINNASGQASATWSPGTNALASYDTAVGGYTQVRVRATAWTSGTMNVGISNQVFAYDPIVAAISQGMSANAAAAVGNPVLMAGWNGTNSYTLRTDTSGQLILGAGANAIGKLAANTGVIVGAVELAPATTNVATNANTTVYANSLVVKATAGTLYLITGYNSKASAQFIQLHDAAALPADAAVPKVVITVPASSNFTIDLGTYGRAFAAGIIVCNSTTGPTKTIGAADCWFDVQYK